MDERTILASMLGSPGTTPQVSMLYDPTSLAGFPGEAALTALLAIAAIAAIASLSSHFYALVQARLDVEKAWAKLEDALARRRVALEELLETARFDDRFQPGVVSDAKRLLLTTPNEGADPLRFAAELRLSTAIGKVLATSQNYPSLARDPRYRKLEETVLDIEEEIERRRELYNAQVALNNKHYGNFFEQFLAGLADVYPWEHFPESESEALADSAAREASGTVVLPGLGDLQRYVRTSAKRPASRAITTSKAIRSPTETSRPQR